MALSWETCNQAQETWSFPTHSFQDEVTILKSPYITHITPVYFKTWLLNSSGMFFKWKKKFPRILFRKDNEILRETNLWVLEVEEVDMKFYTVFYKMKHKMSYLYQKMER